MDANLFPVLSIDPNLSPSLTRFKRNTRLQNRMCVSLSATTHLLARAHIYIYIYIYIQCLYTTKRSSDTFVIHIPPPRFSTVHHLSLHMKKDVGG